MLESLDILIGFTVVMLTFSLVVTAIIQAAVAFFQLRGSKLREGLLELFHQLGLDRAVAAQVAHAVVTHPRLGAGREMFPKGPTVLASVVQREELTQLLLGFAVDAEPVHLNTGSRDALVELLKRLGIEDPKASLEAIRMISMKLEHANPGMAASLRQTQATIEAAESQFVANLHAWFDSSMDRVSQIFTSHVRGITVGVAIVLSIVTGLDSIQIINRLSVDKDLRTHLVTVGSATTSTDATVVQNVQKMQELVSSGLVTLNPIWQWKNLQTVVGVLLSSVMLGLGAPFWFNWLKTLLSLRSTLAEKEEGQRQARTEPSARPAKAEVALKVSEAGDQDPQG